MKIVLFHATLVALCLFLLQGRPSEPPQAVLSGELDLYSTLETRLASSIFNIPETISPGDRLILTIRHTSIQTKSLGSFGQDAALEVVPLVNSSAVELKIASGDVGSNWKIKISYIVINWSSLQSALIIHAITVVSLPLHAQLENGMQIFVYETNQMKVEQNVATQGRQMTVLLTGFTVRGGGQDRNLMARFTGIMNGRTINLSVDWNGIESCLVSFILIDRVKLAEMGLKMETTYDYFPRVTSLHSSQGQILNELQIYNSCSQGNNLAIEKDCWSMRSLSNFQILPIDQHSLAQPAHPVVEYSQRNLGCSFSACTCTDVHATYCVKDLFCMGCYVAACVAGYYPPWFSKTCAVCPVIPHCSGCHIENGKSTASCASCDSGYTSIGGTCVTCPTGCTGCSTVAVNGVEKASCTGCSATLTQQTVGGVTVCSCLTNQYLSAGSCYNCPAACTACTSPIACTGCVSGKYPSGGTCLSCMPICKTCNSGTTCSTCLSTLFTPVGGVCTCNSPYLFDANTKTCVLCSALQSNCATCDYATAYSPSAPPAVICITPSPGYYVAVNGSTAACIPYCTNCSSDPLLCDTPNAGYIFDGTNCICDGGLYFSGGSCLSCTSIMPGCDSCNTNPIPTATTCQVCSSTGYFNSTAYPVTLCDSCAPLCTTCNSLTDCLLCVNTLIPVGGICTCDANASLYYDSTTQDCLSCNLVIFNCQSCASNGSTTVTCSSCGLGRYLASGGLSCASCPITCSDCLNSSFCSSCRSGYDLVNDTCVCGPGCNDCMTNSTDQLCSSCSFGPFLCSGCLAGYLLNGNSTCSPCSLTFTACTECTVTDCMACSAPFVLTPSGCQCNNTAGMYLSVNGSTCLSCDHAVPGCTACTNTGPTTPTTCSASAVGFFIDAGGQSCGSCGGFCLTCSIIATNCGSCLPTYTMMANGSCDCNNTNVQFYDPITQGCSSCSVLLPNCLSCTPSGLNTSCSQCASKMYWNSTTLSCQQCPSSCSDCSSPTTCTSCPDTFVLGQTLPGWTVAGTAGQCVCNNTDGTAPYYDAVTKTCEGCSYFFPSCLTCISSINTTTPTCSACSDGTYLTNGSCVNCPSSCGNCSSATTCTSCPGNLSLSGGACICDAACSQCQLLSIGCVSCSISSGAITACLGCESGMYLSSPNCIACPSACATCTSPTACLTCQPTYQLSGGVCSCATSLGIFPNSASLCVPCADIYYGCVECSVASGSTACLECSVGYYISGVKCLACSASCSSCSISAGSCTGCGQGLILTNSTCLCSDAACTACNSTSPNCAQCTYTILGSFSQCASCQPGFYLSGTSCTICPSDCLSCGANGVCLTCPNTFQVLLGSCSCNNAQALWESAGNCVACTTLYPNCQNCLQNTSTALNVSCSACLFGYYSLNDSCVISVCGDGAITSGQICDDGNTLNNDGCSQYCQLEANFLCTGIPSVCTINLNYHITLSSLTASLSVCNQLSVSFLMDPVYSAYNTANFRNMFSYVSNPNLEYRSWTYNAGIVTYTFAYTDTLNNQTVVFYFAPKNLGINETSTVPVMTITVPLLSDNNMAIVYYPQAVCESKEKIRGLATAVKYASYGTLAVSALPCKIVGLELFGVLQLAFLSTGNMDNVNTMLTPLMEMKGVQGFAMSMGKESKHRLLQSSFTPSRVQSIGYEANFLRNCNVMLAIVVVVIAVAFFLYALTYCCRSCAPSLHKFAKRMLKEVLLTLILFNCFNFAYSAGIHFTYAPKDDSLYSAGTTAAVLALILPVFMALGLMCTEDTGFGEFKEKFKPGVVQRLYFVITILYRSGIGLYVSTMNEDSMSSLMVMGLSIAFLLYNLVNLPYAQAFHNYRANICHFAQAICLFVTMYYRSMMSSTPTTDVASIYGPAYLEMAAILISLIVSLVVLVYEVYLFVKECCIGPSNKEVKPQIVMSTDHQDISHANLEDKEKNSHFSIEFVDLE